MRCKDVYVLDVLFDVYVTPFLFSTIDHTSMLGHVCIGWSNLVVVGEVTSISGLLRFSPFYGCLTRENG
jgi:hypothetical protein